MAAQYSGGDFLGLFGGESVTDKIGNWIENFLQELLGGAVEKNLLTAAENIEGVVTIVEDNVTQTPDTWNNTLYTALQNISNVAIMPIAIGIMSIILCYELITACLDKNSFKEFDTSIFFRFIVKAWVAIYFMNNVFTIFSALLKVGANVAQTAINQLFNESFALRDQLAQLFNPAGPGMNFIHWYNDYSVGDLLCSLLLSLIVYIVSLAIIVIVMIVTAGRMIEILIHFCAAPLPFATMTNKEWSHVGFSFIKTILALALQAFFIVVILAIFVILFSTQVIDALQDLNSLSGALVKWICYGVVCCFMLLKSGSIAKSICGTH